MALETHTVLGGTFSSTTFFVLQDLKFKANLLNYSAVFLNDGLQTHNALIHCYRFCNRHLSILKYGPYISILFFDFNDHLRRLN